jgi:hypothetical protein
MLRSESEATLPLTNIAVTSVGILGQGIYSPAPDTLVWWDPINKSLQI